MSPPVQSLGTAPTPDQVDEWLLASGLEKMVVGKSIEGRDLVVYEETIKETAERPVILFLSLIHGNEPMGLFALLHTVQALQVSHLRRHFLPARILFFPIVNIDAYTLNVEHGGGCRRSNLRPTECENEAIGVLRCPSIPMSGVDLNRNFPVDWNGTYAQQSPKCTSFNYGGSHPFSEPETRAVRDVVTRYNVAAVMSFHSRRSSGSKPLLIHPYTSSRPISEMPRQDLKRFREWSKAMNPSYWYGTGTAIEAIEYTAGGSTIDWMYSVNVTPFVVEASPPCHNRWCPHRPFAIHREARWHSMTARRFTELVVHGAVMSDSLSVVQLVEILMLCSLALITWKYNRHKVVSCVRRNMRRKKVEVAETELQSLT